MNNNVVLSDDDVFSLIEAVLQECGCAVTYLSDYQPDYYLANGGSSYTKYDAGDYLLVELPSHTISFNSPATGANSTTCALVNKLNPILTVRRQGQSDLYDVFFHAQVTGFPVSGVTTSYVRSLILYQVPPGGTGLYDSAIIANMAGNGTLTALEHTYQLVASGTFRKTASEFSLVTSMNYSLPFHYNGTLTIDYCQIPNKYWDGETATQYYSITNTPVYNAPLNGAPQFYQTLSLQTESAVFQQGSSDFSNIMSLDTDDGGMTDYHEWYQTDHDLTDPNDDDENTITPPTPEEDIPEGESVVDIGRDTVNRYDNYWDEQLGDFESLPSISPSSVTPLDALEPEDIDIQDMISDVQGAFDSNIEQNTFKGKFDDLFSPLSNNDQKLTWTINPSINNSMVNFPMSTITIDPQSWVNDANYGQYFVLFRGCLVLFEFLVFIYGCYKLILSNISGTSQNAGDEET